MKEKTDIKEKPSTQKKISSSLEDYIETIYYICRRRNEARSSEIAEYLNIKRSSVTRALQQLNAMGLVVYSKYKRVLLSPQGKICAEEILERIRYAYTFLHFVLGFDTEQADSSARIMKKGLSQEVIERIKLFLSHHSRTNPLFYADCNHNKERCMLCQISDIKKKAR